MSSNNVILRNEAIAGFIGGAFRGRNIKDATSTDYDTISAAAAAFATEVDSLITTDGGITVYKCYVMQQICSAVISGITTDATAGDYAVLAAAVKALYTSAIANLVSS